MFIPCRKPYVKDIFVCNIRMISYEKRHRVRLNTVAIVLL